MVVDTHFYDILGVPPNASKKEIKQAFMRKARELHPDKNRNNPNATANFQELNEAYETLKDPVKRRNYDQFGINGVKEGGQNFEMNFFNDFMNFSSFDGFGFPFDSRIYQQHETKTKDITYTLKCTLEDLYNGRVKTLQLQRSRICKKCKGSGLKKGKKTHTCNKCKGTGEVITKKQIDANSFIQKINQCSVCNGTGQFIYENDKCPECQGKTVVDETKKIQVHITKGMENGEEIAFKGESNEIPGAEPGDFIVGIQEIPHKIFKRNFANLMIRKEITLSEALLGVTFPLTHLDGRILIISNKEIKSKKSTNNQPYSIIKNGCTMVVEGEGMPHKDNSFIKGDLFIYFDVKFPISNEIFSKEFCEVLDKTFPRNNEAEKINLKDDDVCEVTLLDSNIDEFKNARKSYKTERNEAYDDSSSDDYHESGCNPM